MRIASNMKSQGARRTARAAASATCALLLLAESAAPALADPTSQAQRIYQRIAGVQPSDATLTTMAADISGGNALAAAQLATADPSFYNVVLKNFVTPWTNRDQTVFAPLNDYTATVIGMVRDDVAFNSVLSADILYKSNASGLPAVSAANNNHYATAEQNGIDLKATLVASSQSAVYGLPTTATAGVMTTRGAASAFFINGTNRAMFRFTLINHLCTDLNPIMDITRPPDRVRQDVSRSPGGDSRIFLNNCIGCHAAMDPMAQAFAYYNFDGVTTNETLYTQGVVQAKYLINSQNFSAGFITPNDSWANRWRQGPNQVLGWSAALPGSGSGAKSLGQELAASSAFAQCQVQKVFKAVCFRAPQNQADRTQIATMVSSFKSGGYKLKQVFAESAVYCMGP
jgi:hypothetical protein